MGFGEGVDIANRMEEGHRAVRAEDRRDKQIRLANLIKGYEDKGDGRGYQPTEMGQQSLELQAQKLANELKAEREKNYMMQSMLNERSMTAGMKQLAKGNIKDAWDEIKRNPILTKTLAKKGLHGLAPIDWHNDIELIDELKNAGAINDITPEQLQDPKVVRSLNSHFHKAMDENGNWKVVPTEALIKETGTLNYLNRQDRKGMADRYNKTMSILKGNKIFTPEEELLKTKNIDAQIAKADYSNALNELKLADLEEWQIKNPDGTVAEYLSAIGQNKPLSEKERLKIEEVKAREEAQKAEKGFIDELSTIKKVTPEIYSRAKDIEIANKKAGIALPAATIKDVYDSLAPAKDFIRLSSELGDIKRDALEKIKKDVSMIVGIENSLGFGTPQEKAKKFKEAIAKIKFETKLGLAIAKYVKKMSGSAVTESEFERYNVFSQAGTWSDVSAAKAAIDAFSESLTQELDDKLESIKYKNPWTYLNRKNEWRKFKDTTEKKLEEEPSIVVKRRPLSDFGGF